MASSDGVPGSGWTFVIGGVTAAGLFGCIYAVGRVSGVETQILLQVMITSLRYLGQSVVTAAATILGLMLTLLALSQTTNQQLSPVHHRRIRLISILAAGAIAAGILLILFSSIPTRTSDGVPGTWFGTIYTSLLAYACILTGLVITIVAMLYNAIVALVRTLSPEGKSPLAKDDGG